MTGTVTAPGWRATRAVLHGPLRILVSGQGLGQFADGLAQVSFAQLILFDIGKGATPARITAVLAVTLLPFSLAGPVAGVFVDRWDRRSTLVVASRVRAVLGVLFAVVAAFRSEPASFAGVVLLLSSSRFVLAAKGAALPRTVRADHLVTANSVSALVGMVMAFGGAVLGAGLVGVSTVAGFIAAAAVYLAAGLVFTRLPEVGGGASSPSVRSSLARLIGEMGAGLRYVVTTDAVRRPLLAVWVHRLLLGGGFILLVLVADHRYHLQASGYAVALAVTGVAALAGSVTAPILAARWSSIALLPLAFLPPAMAALVAGYWPSLPFLLMELVVAGFAFQILKVLVDALVGGASDDLVRGRVFTMYDVVYNIAFVLAGLGLVLLWGAGAERRLMWWLSAAFGVGWLAFARMLRAWPFQPTAPAARSTAGWATFAALPAGAVPVLAFPRAGLPWVAWIALVPWLLLIRKAPSVRAAGWRGLLGGAGFVAAVDYWLAPSTGVFFLLVVSLLGLLWIPWAAGAHLLLAGTARARPAAALIILPSGWLVIEAIRSWSSLGGPWGLLGTTQWHSSTMLGLASLGGVWLVSFLLVTANVAVVMLLAGRGRDRLLPLSALALTALAGPLWHAIQSPPEGAGTWQVAVVQPGVVRGTAERLGASERLTKSLTDQHLDLIVWGESSVGFDLATRPDLLQELTSLSGGVHAPVLVNVDARDADQHIRKRAVLIDPQGIRAAYDKMRLVPFGEYIPLRNALGWLHFITKAAAEDRHRGDHLVVMRAGSVGFTPLICFESAFPDLSRHAAQDGADLIVVQTATTTFQGSWAADQHASLAALRAAETGRPVIQAALSGTSAAFTATGRRLAWLPSDRTGVLRITVPLATRSTPYLRYGDWVLAIAFVILGLALISAGLVAAPPPVESSSGGPAPQAPQRP